MKEYDYINIIKGIIDSDLNIIGDDTAIIKDSGLVLTCDTLVEGVHFDLQTTSARKLGYKAGAVNLSDVAASGGSCDYLLVSLALPAYLNERFIEEFYGGLKELCDRFQCYIVGGDLVSSKQLVITITAIGKSQANVSRSFARPGQYLLTTGTAGNSHMGLLLLEGEQLSSTHEIPSEELKALKHAHLKPEPRMKESQFIVNKLESKNICMMDTSDGLADAVFQISKKSNVQIDIYIDNLPISKELENIGKVRNIDPVDFALYGGEDFELIFTLDAKDINNFENNKTFNFTIIGEIKSENQGVSLIYPDSIVELTEKTLESTISFKHF